jgi:hypothetical protein
VFYIWLYGFAQARAAITDEIAEKQESVGWEDPGIRMVDGHVVKTDEDASKPKDKSTGVEKTGAKLAYATGVVYGMLWIFHVLILVLPTEGMGRELEYASFKRRTAERRVERMRDQEGRILRGVVARTFAANGKDREELIREAQPVAKRINEAARREVMVPRQPGCETHSQEASAGQGQAFDDPEEVTGETVATNTPNIGMSMPGEEATTPDNVYDSFEGIFDSPPVKLGQNNLRQQP